MHKLLKRQLVKSQSADNELGVDFEHLCELVSGTYEGLYLDQKRANRANTLMSNELEELNANLTLVAESSGEQSKWFNAAINNMPHGFCLYNEQNEMVVFNRKYATIYGLDSNKISVGMTFREQLQMRINHGIFGNGDAKKYIDFALKIIEKREPSIKIHNLNNGQEVEVVFQPLDSGGYLITHADVTERRAAERKIYHLANRDALTSLPNRRSFFDKLETLTKAYKGFGGKKLIVGLLDLDGFKRINDVFGHPAGDDLLIKTGERLSDVLGVDVMLARLGGDEFGVIITEDKDIENIVRVGQKICEAMRHVFHLREGSVQIGASVGFVEYPSMADNAQLMFERADYALCYSKQHSKGAAVIFSKKHETIIREVANIEHQLSNANLDEELSMLFQPIVDLHTHKTVGFEALARWNNPVLGNVGPDMFIGSAEQMGAIGKLTTILLKKALASACQWPNDVYLSFNLSTYDLSSEKTVLNLISIVEKSNFPNNRIVFEVTETAVMQDFELANRALELLKLQGAHIALDDFGTGYSSLSYVQRMPLDRLKIDRSFISEVHTDKNSRNIVKTITDLCNNLNLYCIVEGVENEQQLAVLEDMGCRYFQGYYFSRPLTHDNALKFLEANDIVWTAAPRYGT